MDLKILDSIYLMVTVYYWTDINGKYYTTICMGGYYYILTGEQTDDEIYDFVGLLFDFNYKENAEDSGRYTKDEWEEINCSIYYEFEFNTFVAVN